jgi:hypothetical protein
LPTAGPRWKWRPEGEEGGPPACPRFLGPRPSGQQPGVYICSGKCNAYLSHPRLKISIHLGSGNGESLKEKEIFKKVNEKREVKVVIKFVGSKFAVLPEEEKILFSESVSCTLFYTPFKKVSSFDVWKPFSSSKA